MMNWPAAVVVGVLLPLATAAAEPTTGPAADPAPSEREQREHQLALDAYPTGEGVRAEVNWALAARGRGRRPLNVLYNPTWHRMADERIAPLLPRVEAEIERLEESGLIATAAMLRHDLRVFRRSSYTPLEYGPIVSQDAKEVSPFADVLLAFDPPLSARNGPASHFIDRLHRMPWIDRGLSKTFGLRYASADELRTAADALDVYPGYVELTRVDGKRTLAPSADELLIKTLDPWEALALSGGRTPASETTLREAETLEQLQSELQEQSNELKAEKSKIDDERRRLSQAIDAFNADPSPMPGPLFGTISTQERRERLEQWRTTFNKKSADYNRRAEKLATKKKELAERQALANERALRETTRGRREADEELDGLLRDWYLQRLDRHAQALRAAGRTEGEVREEIAIASWLVGLSDGRQFTISGFTAEGHRQAKFEAMRRDLWTLGDAGDIADGLIDLFRTAGRDYSDIEGAIEEIAPLIEQHARRFGDEPLRQAMAERHIRAGHPLYERFEQILADLRQ